MTSLKTLRFSRSVRLKMECKQERYTSHMGFDGVVEPKDEDELNWVDTPHCVAEIITRSPPIIPILLQCSSVPMTSTNTATIRPGDVVKLTRIQPVDVVQASLEVKGLQRFDERQDYNGVSLPSTLVIPKSLTNILFEIVCGSVRYAFNSTPMGLGDSSLSTTKSHRGSSPMRFKGVRALSDQLPKFVKVIKATKTIRQNTKIVDGHVLEVMGVHSPWATKDKFLSCRIAPDGDVCRLDLKWKGVYEAVPDTKEYNMQDLLLTYRLPVTARVRSFAPTDWMPHGIASQLKAIKTLDLKLIIEREITMDYVIGINGEHPSLSSSQVASQSSSTSTTATYSTSSKSAQSAATSTVSSSSSSSPPSHDRSVGTPGCFSLVILSKNVDIEFMTSSDMTMNPQKYQRAMSNFGGVTDGLLSLISKEIYLSDPESQMMEVIPFSKLQPPTKSPVKSAFCCSASEGDSDIGMDVEQMTSYCHDYIDLENDIYEDAENDEHGERPYEQFGGVTGEECEEMSGDFSIQSGRKELALGLRESCSEMENSSYTILRSPVGPLTHSKNTSNIQLLQQLTLGATSMGQDLQDEPDYQVPRSIYVQDDDYVHATEALTGGGKGEAGDQMLSMQSHCSASLPRDLPPPIPRRFSTRVMKTQLHRADSLKIPIFPPPQHLPAPSLPTSPDSPNSIAPPTAKRETRGRILSPTANVLLEAMNSSLFRKQQQRNSACSRQSPESVIHPEEQPIVGSQAVPEVLPVGETLDDQASWEKQTPYPRSRPTTSHQSLEGAAASISPRPNYHSKQPDPWISSSRLSDLPSPPPDADIGSLSDLPVADFPPPPPSRSASLASLSSLNSNASSTGSSKAAPTPTSASSTPTYFESDFGWTRQQQTSLSNSFTQTQTLPKSKAGGVCIKRTQSCSPTHARRNPQAARRKLPDLPEPPQQRRPAIVNDQPVPVIEFSVSDTHSLVIRSRGRPSSQGNLLEDVRPPPPPRRDRASSMENLLKVGDRADNFSRTTDRCTGAPPCSTFSDPNRTAFFRAPPALPKRNATGLMHAQTLIPVANIAPRPSPCEDSAEQAVGGVSAQQGAVARVEAAVTAPAVAAGSRPWIGRSCSRDSSSSEDDGVIYAQDENYLMPDAVLPSAARPVRLRSNQLSQRRATKTGSKAPQPPVVPTRDHKLLPSTVELATVHRTISSIRDIPDDITSLSCEEVAHALGLLKVADDVIAEFEKHQMNGGLLTSMTEEILQTEFKMTPFYAVKIMKFVNGWRPSEDIRNTASVRR